MKNSNQLWQQRQVTREWSMGHHAYSVACVSVNTQKASGTAGKIFDGTFLMLGGSLNLIINRQLHIHTRVFLALKCSG